MADDEGNLVGLLERLQGNVVEFRTENYFYTPRGGNRIFQMND